LRNDDARNEMICADVLSALHDGRSPLLLTERLEHLEQLTQRLAPVFPNIAVLHGGMSREATRSAMTRLADRSDSTGSLILATGQYIGEGSTMPDSTPCS
jgi:hypothetical protein